jgi:hypothetical protein
MLDICPLLMIAIKEPGFISDIEEKQARCLKGDCAWFVANEDQGTKIRGRKDAPSRPWRDIFIL